MNIGIANGKPSNYKKSCNYNSQWSLMLSALQVNGARMSCGQYFYYLMTTWLFFVSCYYFLLYSFLKGTGTSRSCHSDSSNCNRLYSSFANPHPEHLLPEGCALRVLSTRGPPFCLTWATRSSLSFGLVETGLSPRGSCLHRTGDSATPWENEERNVNLVQWGRWSAISCHSSQLGGGFNPPTPPLAAGRSFHSGHLYSGCVNVVACLVLLSTQFVTVFFHVLIRLLQNPIRRLPKMSHVCWHGCLQDVSAERCRAMQEASDKTTLAQDSSLFIRQNTIVEQRGASGSALAIG